MTMKYFTAIDAVEGLESESVPETDGVMLTGEDCLMRLEEQRMLMQSLLIDPPETDEDARLEKLYRGQKALWEEKIGECIKMQLCIRLPDRPIDAFLPKSKAEVERLSAYMGKTADWLHAQTEGLRSMNPDLSCRGCRMLISNERTFRVFLEALFTTAQECGVQRLSVLIPFVTECREVYYLKSIIAGSAVAHQLTCDIGVEIATPRAACIAEELAVCADAIVFNVDELVQLLYGMSKKDTRKVISHYLHEKVFQHNPFFEFDEIGVGTLLTIAIQQIRRVRPELRLSAIGYPTLTERGRKFCDTMGIDMLIGPQHLFHAESIFQAEMEHEKQKDQEKTEE